ncbi:ras suppressor 1 isoform X1 [Chlorella sorokiniana]|uniref:Ras suppressor 1 isoform X1 n=1 Tax=Chlorella sorokiniana TaxID=3076 RepID=A0A2P6TSV2_CHLSO|nr:ras suppressor 1 isoform X1 [Chlorella sorokiniana]|eukprot:PRW57145.1 ras suppressor 1 isoform X1 [Chlorella sorokiniana]
MSKQRRQQKHRSNTAGPPAPWGTLPTELLVAILGHLTLEERHRAAVCVSKQWHDACYTPALLCKLIIGRGWNDDDSWGLPRLEALCAWLVRRRPVQHADSVWLSLFLPTSTNHEEPAEELSQAAVQERETLAACMAAVSATASSRLRSLELFADCTVLTTAGWPPGLTALTSLSLGNSSGRLSLSPELRSLRGVLDLELYAMEGIEEEHNLPPGVTRLSWDELAGFELPYQLSSLRHLRFLEVSCWKMQPGDFGALAELTSLRHLMLTNACLPDSLYRLTWLRSLHMDAFERQQGLLPGLEGTLPALQQLTALALGDVPLWRPGLVAALGALPHLHRLSLASAWRGYSGRLHGGKRTLPPADMPAPAFLGRLTWLGLDADLLVRNPHLLAAATQLQHLWLLGDGLQRGAYSQPWRRLMKLVRQHPRLRSVSLRPSHDSCGYVEPVVTCSQRRDLEALQRTHPHLTFNDYPATPMSLDDLWLPFFAE